MNARLHARQIIPSPKCTFCEEDETILHLFFNCPFAKQIWQEMPFSSNPLEAPAETITDGLHRVMRATPLPPTGVSATQLGAWVIWVIWITRNQKIFQDRTFTSHESTLKALINAKEWQEGQRTESIINLSHPSPSFEAPIDAIVCRSDAAWKSGIPGAGIAWSFYHANGEIISSHSKPISFVNSSLVAEGLALREAMEHAWSLGLTSLIFESDSKQLVTAVEGEKNFSDLHGIVSDIISIFIAFDFSAFKFRNHSAFTLEDCLAKQALGLVVPTIFP